MNGSGAGTTMEHYIWLFDRKDNGGLGIPLLGSLLLHALLFVVLASTSIYRPLIGEAEKLDIVWLYPSLLYGGRTEPAEEVSLPPEREPEVAAPRAQAPPLPQPEPAREPATREKVPETPPPPQAEEPAPQPVVTVPPPPEPAEPEPELEMKMPAAVEPPPEEAKEAKVEAPVKSARTPEREKAAAAEPAPAREREKSRETPEKRNEPALPPVVKEAGRPAEPVKAAAKAPIEQAAPPREPVAPAEAAPPRERKEPAKPPATPVTPVAPVAPALPRSDERKRPEVAPQPAPLLPGTPDVATVATVRKAEPAPVAKPAPPVKTEEEKPPRTAETKGLFIPQVSGDLALEITGKDDLLRRIRVTVLFREFSKARRNRPLSKVEARRVQTLTPKTATTGDGTLRAVIEVAGEGVYEFKVETDSLQATEASYALKLYEKSSKARTRPLGARRVAHRESIVKILMPEGIVWEDDSAFSGDMEDSDSVTKFNTDTGLVWKEYK